MLYFLCTSGICLAKYKSVGCLLGRLYGHFLKEKGLGLQGRNWLADLRIIFGTNGRGKYHWICRDMKRGFPTILGSRLAFEGQDIWAGVFVRGEADGRICINPPPPQAITQNTVIRKTPRE